MRKRPTKPAPGSSAHLGKQMLLKELGFGPGAMNGESLLLMQCVVLEKGKTRLQTFTIAITDDEVDKFLTSTQRGVAMYKEIRAKEGC